MFSWDQLLGYKEKELGKGHKRVSHINPFLASVAEFDKLIP